MSSISEVYNSTKAAMHERLSHPILGSLIIFWFIFNWKAVLFVVFSDENMLYKFKWVNENHTDIVHNFGYPIFCAFAFTILLPLIALYLKIFTNKLNLWSFKIDFRFKKAVEALNKSYSDNDIKTVERISQELDDTKEALNAVQTGLNNELDKLKERFNMFTPLMLETEIPRNLLNKHLNSKELCKLNVLVALYSTDKKTLNIAELLNRDDNLSEELLVEILKEFTYRGVIECDDDAYNYPGTFVELLDDGVLEILDLRAKVISEEMDLTNNINLPSLV